MNAQHRRARAFAGTAADGMRLQPRRQSTIQLRTRTQLIWGPEAENTGIASARRGASASADAASLLVLVQRSSLSAAADVGPSRLLRHAPSPLPRVAASASGDAVTLESAIAESFKRDWSAPRRPEEAPGHMTRAVSSSSHVHARLSTARIHRPTRPPGAPLARARRWLPSGAFERDIQPRAAAPTCSSPPGFDGQ